MYFQITGLKLMPHEQIKYVKFGCPLHFPSEWCEYFHIWKLSLNLCMFSFPYKSEDMAALAAIWRQSAGVRFRKSTTLYGWHHLSSHFLGTLKLNNLWSFHNHQDSLTQMGRTLGFEAEEGPCMSPTCLSLCPWTRCFTSPVFFFLIKKHFFFLIIL